MFSSSFLKLNKLKQNFIWRGKWLPISHEGMSQGIQSPLPPPSSLFLSYRNRSCCSLLKGRSKERELTRGRAARRRAARRSACMFPGPRSTPRDGRPVCSAPATQSSPLSPQQKNSHLHLPRHWLGAHRLGLCFPFHTSVSIPCFLSWTPHIYLCGVECGVRVWTLSSRDWEG